MAGARVGVCPKGNDSHGTIGSMAGILRIPTLAPTNLYRHTELAPYYKDQHLLVPFPSGTRVRPRSGCASIDSGPFNVIGNFVQQAGERIVLVPTGGYDLSPLHPADPDMQPFGTTNRPRPPGLAFRLHYPRSLLQARRCRYAVDQSPAVGGLEERISMRIADRHKGISRQQRASQCHRNAVSQPYSAGTGVADSERRRAKRLAGRVTSISAATRQVEHRIWIAG